MNSHFQQPAVHSHPNRFINHELIKGPQALGPQNRPNSNSYSPPPQQIVKFQSIEGRQINQQPGNMIIRGQNYHSPPPGYRIVPQLPHGQLSGQMIQTNNFKAAIKPESVRRMEDVVRTNQNSQSQKSMIEFLNITQENPKITLKSGSPRSGKPNLIVTGPPPSQSAHPSQSAYPNSNLKTQPNNNNNDRNWDEVRHISQNKNESRAPSSQRKENAGIRVTLNEANSAPKSHPALKNSRQKSPKQGISVISKNNVQQIFPQTHKLIPLNKYKQSVIKQTQSYSSPHPHPQQSTLNQHKTTLKVYSSYEEYLSQKQSGIHEHHPNQPTHTIVYRQQSGVNNYNQIGSVMSFNSKSMQYGRADKIVEDIQEGRPRSNISDNSKNISSKSYNSNKQPSKLSQNSHELSVQKYHQKSHINSHLSQNRQQIIRHKSVSHNSEISGKNNSNSLNKYSVNSSDKSGRNIRNIQILGDYGISGKPQAINEVYYERSPVSQEYHKDSIQHGNIQSDHSHKITTTIISQQRSRPIPYNENNHHTLKQQFADNRDQNKDRNIGIVQKLRQQMRIQLDGRLGFDSRNRYNQSILHDRVLHWQIIQDNPQYASSRQNLNYNEEENLQYFGDQNDLKNRIIQIYESQKERGLQRIKEIYVRVAKYCQI